MQVRRTTPLIVGTLTLVGIAAVIVFAFSQLKVLLWDITPSYALCAEFDNSSGLKVGDSIQIAGVKVGEVSSITLLQEKQRARVTLEMNEGVRVDDKAVASIKTSDLIGDKYIALSNGAGKPLKDRGVIKDTHSSFVLEDAVRNVVNGSSIKKKGDSERSSVAPQTQHDDKSLRPFAIPHRFGGSARIGEYDPAFNFPATNLTIFSTVDRRMIGRGRYSSAKIGSTDLIRGENKYLDGAHDIELDYLKPEPSGYSPILVRHEYSSFNSDGSPQFDESLDPASGFASCAQNVNGTKRVYRATLEVPSDTYAGATQLMLIVSRLRRGVRQTVSFHSFNCVPAPKIFLISVTIPSQREEWPMYPGRLIKLEIQPNFGWLNALIAPFLPKLSFWFDPQDDWNYVGGTYDRYYKGPHILSVRDRSVRSAARSH